MRSILLCICLSFSLGIYAQFTDSILVQKQHIEALQQLRPDFHYHSNREIFTELLKKHWLNDYAIYLKNGGPKIKWSSDKKEFYLQLAELFFDVNQTPKIEKEVSEQDVINYYAVNKDQFRSPIFVSFYQCWNPIQNKVAKEIIEKEFRERKELIKKGQLDNSKKMLGEASFNFEEQIEIQNFIPHSQKLKSLKIMELSEAINHDQFEIYYLVTERKGGELKAFEEVKDICKNKLKESQRLEKEKELNQLIDSWHLIIDIKDTQNEK